jgi:hypothetical protein
MRMVPFCKKSSERCLRNIKISPFGKLAFSFGQLLGEPHLCKRLVVHNRLIGLSSNPMKQTISHSELDVCGSRLEVFKLGRHHFG